MRTLRPIRAAAAALTLSAFAALSALFAPVACADTVVAHLDANDPASPADWVPVQFDGNANFGTILAGRLNWVNLTAGSGFPSPLFHTFCLEVDVDLDLDTHTFTAGDLATRLDAYGAGLGAVKADRLAELWGEFYDQLDTPAAGAAFQLAVWETIYDFGLADNQLLANGRFQVLTDPQSQTVPAYVSLANTWVDSLDGQGPRANLTALLSPTTQDQLTLTPVAVPLPGAAAGGLALLGIMGFRRGRRPLTP